MGDSMATRVSLLAEAERQAILGGLDLSDLLTDFSFWGRPEQFVPEGSFIHVYSGGRGAGKALGVDTPILTVAGWKTMGSLQVGDKLYDEMGEECSVTHVFAPYIPKKLFRLTFSDDSTLDADAEHQWITRKKYDSIAKLHNYTDQCINIHSTVHKYTSDCINIHPQVRTTQEIIDSFEKIHTLPPVKIGKKHIPEREIVAYKKIAPRTVRCIAVDSPRSLFLIGKSLIPTHNSRAGAEFVRDRAMKYPGCRIALVGRTSGDTLSVMINGDSGIMNVSPPSERPQHMPSKRMLIWPNGSMAETYSAEEPDQLRGPQFHFSWADEFAAWKYVKDQGGLNAWDNLRIGTRLEYDKNEREADPQIFATTTPKRVESLIGLLQEAKTHPNRISVSTGTTYDNAANLSEVNLEVITGLYEGSDIAAQELMGQMLEERTGALWSETMIHSHRSYSSSTPRLPIRVVAVDPSVAENPKDECGIVVIGATNHRKLFQRHAYVLEDASIKASPEIWGQVVVDIAKKWRAPVVVETNQGGALVPLTLKNIDPTIKVHTVTATKNKKTRAEPTTTPYSQGRVHHWGVLGLLESQMLTWDPELSKKSPDRVDALVWGLYATLIAPPKGLFPARMSARASRKQLPTGLGTGLR